MLRLQVSEFQVPHIDAVDGHSAGVHIVKARHQARERRFASAARTYERAYGARRDVYRDVAQHGTAFLVTKRHVLEGEFAA